MKCVERWIALLRHKAATYEHTARKLGKTVIGPSIDELCNEMEAFNDAISLKAHKD